jgi:ribose 5-phosphate isomerase B
MALAKQQAALYSIAWNNITGEPAEMKVAIANDHAGVELKRTLTKYMEQQGIEVINLGTDQTQSTDYPDYAKEVALLVQGKKSDLGIVICGTGIGASITANKFKGIHAALCYSVFTAKMARLHNNANIMCLGARTIHEEDAIAMVTVFLSETFSGERHARRVDKIKAMEEENFRPV